MRLWFYMDFNALKLFWL